MKHTALNYQSAEIAQIVKEVAINGFYAVDLARFLPKVANQVERIYITELIANRANLRVSLNLEKNLCIFESNF